MNSIHDVDQVLRAYPAVPSSRSCEPLGSSGGFSGARLWKVTCRHGDYCLRRWPAEHPDEGRLRFIHDVLRTVYERGVPAIPLPLATTGGATFVRYEGAFWELTPWMPGRADFHEEPTVEKLRAALQWLAQFHRAAKTHACILGPSPGIAQREELLRRLNAGEAAKITARLSCAGATDFATRGRRILAAYERRRADVGQLLAEARNDVCSLQPCIRDIWHDHVLFQGDRVSGVVDYGALRVECVAGDIARLLGSLVRDDGEQWRLGLKAYDEIRPLTATEQRLAGVFDASGVLLSGMNWLRWICLEGRRFDRPDLVLARLDQILGRLERPLRLCVE